MSRPKPKGKYISYSFYPCSICGTDQFQVVYSFGLFSYRQKITVCKNCGVVCLNPRWDEKTYAEYYRAEYYGKYQPPVTTDNVDALGKIKPGLRSINIFNDLGKFINKDANIIEIGCGTGDNLITFKRNGFEHLTGLDASSDCCHRLQQLEIASINKSFTAYISDANPVAEFDCVILSHMLEHFVEPEKSLTMISRILKPTGILYILIPDFYGFTKPYAQFTVAHTFYFSQASLATLLNNSGYVNDKYCASEPGEIAVVARKSSKKLAAVTSNAPEYRRVLSHLRMKRRYYIEIKARGIFEAMLGWLIMRLLREEAYLTIRSRLRKLYILK